MSAQDEAARAHHAHRRRGGRVASLLDLAMGVWQFPLLLKR
jgi:hypothetical protein